MAVDAVRRVVIIGASGLVGQALVRAFSRRRPEIKLMPLQRPWFDLTKPSSWSQLDIGVDCIVHTAALIEGSSYDVFNTNVLTMGELATHCKTIGARKFVYVSTGAVYGSTSRPTTIETAPNPRGDYAVSKWLAEKKLREILGSAVHVLRLYFPYGPGQRLPRLIPRLRNAIMRGDAVHCNPDGGPRFNLTHVDDLADVLLSDFVLDSSAPPLANIASDQILSTEDIALQLAKQLGRPLTLIRDGYQSDALSAPYRPGCWRPFVVEDAMQCPGAGSDYAPR